MAAAAYLDFALELAQAARAQTLPLWRAGCAVENKAADGFDPVTDADRSAEAAIRRLIAERFPDHGVSGEEWPDRPAGGSLSWSLDPIDGTRSFMCGLPTWTTLIALLDRGQPVLGIIDAPVLGEIYAGVDGAAMLLAAGDRRPLRASGCDRLADARFSTTDPFLLTDSDALAKVRGAARVTRYGHDAYGYARLAAGSLDLVIESGLKPHDYNALIPVIRSAGAHFGDWRGGEEFASGAVIAAATRRLYDEAVALLER